MRGDGNGDAPILSLRFLRTIWRPRPKGPFTGRDIENALIAERWVLVEGPPNKWHTYRHPDKPARVTFNLEWNAIYEGDVVFQTLRRHMEITSRQLIALLTGP
jgi:hypothetical protein